MVASGRWPGTAFLLRELFRSIWVTRARLLFEEFLWNELLAGRYQGERRLLVLKHLVRECLDARRWAGERAERCNEVLNRTLRQFEGDIPFESFPPRLRDEMLRWPGLSQFPEVRRRLAHLRAVSDGDTWPP